MNTKPPASWAEFWARFFWGALFGLFAGASFCLEQKAGSWREWMIALSASGGLFGLTAGWLGDRLWYTMLRLSGW